MSYPILDNEKALLLQLSSGDESAFVEVFEHYHPNIYTTALRISGSEQLAEEVVQDVFLKIWLKREDLGGIDNFPAWLRTIATHLVYNALKSRKRRLLQEQEYRSYPHLLFHQDPADGFQDKEYKKILELAIQQLPPKQRQTYILTRQQGMKREEVARELQVSPETVKYNMEQAVRNVRAFCLTHLHLVTVLVLISRP
jgi:RNA polymerase sigma-70 factor (ECF subfamily)